MTAAALAWSDTHLVFLASEIAFAESWRQNSFKDVDFSTAHNTSVLGELAY